MVKTKCECPENTTNNPNPKSWYDEEEYKAMYHKPNKCKGDYGLRQYRRGNKLITLCSACNLAGDIPV